MFLGTKTSGNAAQRSPTLALQFQSSYHEENVALDLATTNHVIRRLRLDRTADALAKQVLQRELRGSEERLAAKSILAERLVWENEVLHARVEALELRGCFP